MAEVVVVEKAWAGVDVGKGFHWAHVVDASGTELLSRRVKNEEAHLITLIEEVLSLAGDVVWAVDQPVGGAALLLALLWRRGQEVFYVPGLRGAEALAEKALEAAGSQRANLPAEDRTDRFATHRRHARAMPPSMSRV